MKLKMLLQILLLEIKALDYLKITRTVNSIGYNKNLVKALKGKDKAYPKFW